MTSEKRDKNYKGKDPMSPEEITSHEPTAVQRGQDTGIVEGGDTGTNTQEAKKNREKKV